MSITPRTTTRRTQRAVLAFLLAIAPLSACRSDPGDTSADNQDADSTIVESATSAPTGNAGADSDTNDADSPDEVIFPGADWELSSPETEGFDAEALEHALDAALIPTANTQGVVVVRHGKIVTERYADGAASDSWAASWSVAKSFASALVGIAVDEGNISSVDTPMTTWFPDWEARGLGDITLRHVLQMSTGLQWNEDYNPSNGPSDIIALVTSHADQLAYAAALPKEAEPGTVFNYSSGVSLLLGEVIAQSTGMSADDYAREKLFDPMQFSKADWWQDAAGHTLTYCCVDTTSRDFARFGWLYLNDGNWDGTQLVPASWVEESLTGAPTSPDQYGYQWWLEDYPGVPDDMFMARGFDGQYIFAIPSLDLVVVRNGTYVKDPGPAVADPNLFAVYPPNGFIPGKGTIAPSDGWDTAGFIAGVVAAIHD